MTQPAFDPALHRQHAMRQRGKRFARNALWKLAHPRARLVLYGPAVFENPYQTLLYSAFDARVSVSSVERAVTYRKAGIADVYHLHWDEFHLSAAPDGVTPAYCAPLTAFRAGGGKLVWTVHNARAHDDMDPAKKALFQAGRRFLCDTADLIHVHSPQARDLICAEYGADPARICLIAHPSYAGWYRPSDPAPAPKPAFVAFGAFRANKGLEVILEGFRRLDPDVPVGDIHIAGRAADSAGPDPVAGRPVRITEGFIPDDAIAGLFGTADFAVFGFTQILTSGSLLLALTYGAVPIAPDLPLLRDVLPPALHPLLFAPGDADDLARVLAKAARMRPAERATLQQAVAATTAASSPETVSRALEKAINALFD